jgi:hypothetical protein
MLELVFCYFSAMHTVLRRKSKDWLGSESR